MEILDLYNKDRIKTGKTMVRGEKVPEGSFRLVVHCCIFNNEGKMLIQHRVPTKSHWPNKWDITCGGCVASGETSGEGMTRELKEELGIDFDFSNMAPLFSFNFIEGFDDVYIIQKDIDIDKLTFQTSEVDSAMYVTKEEIKQMMNEGSFIKYAESYIDLLFEVWKNPDLYLEA